SPVDGALPTRPGLQAELQTGAEVMVHPSRETASGVHAPYLPRRPACASASDIRYIAWNCPRPPRRQYDSPNSVTPSGRHVFAHSTVGTGCQLWPFSLLGV